MSVTTCPVAKRAVEGLSTGSADEPPVDRVEVSVLDQWGGPDLSLAAGFHPDIRACVGELIAQLRIKCGSLTQGSARHAYQMVSPSSWRTLREGPAYEIIDACRRVERTFANFQLPGSDAQPVHVRIAYLLHHGATR